MDFSFSKPGLGRFRVNAYRQRGTYSLAIRLLPFEIPKFDTLGLPQVIKTFAMKSRAGAGDGTGSGKSTTLASIIGMINEQRKAHIITIEDPIEYLHRQERPHRPEKWGRIRNPSRRH